MKKYALIAVMGAFCFGANAQSRFSIGPNAGVGSTWIDNVDGKKFKTHGNFGLSMVFSANPNFGIGTDLKYSFEGGKAETTSGGLISANELSLDYLRLPIKAIYFFGKPGNRMRPKISAGPSLGFLMGAKSHTTVKNATGTIVLDQTVKSKDGFNSFDIGLNGAAGLHYRMVDKTWLVAEVAYYHGLRDINENNPSGSTQNKNRNLGLNVGVNFGL